VSAPWTFSPALRTAKRLQELFLNGAAKNSQVLAKRVIRVSRAFREIIGKPQLRAQRRAGTDRVCLGPFALPDASRGFQDLPSRPGIDEGAPVVVGEHDIVLARHKLAERGRAPRVLLPRIQPLRTRRARAATPNR